MSETSTESIGETAPAADWVRQRAGAVANALLQMDAGSQAHLQRLEGREIEVVLRDWFVLRIAVAAGRIDFVDPDTAANPADARIEADGAAVREMVLEGSRIPAGIRIQGEVQVVEALRDLLRDFQPSLQPWLTPWIGRQRAERIEQLAAECRTALESGVTKARRDAAEWLTEESGLTPARPEVEAWSAAVDTLRADLDRLEARVRRLEARGPWGGDDG